jgi:hypothetical protein
MANAGKSEGILIGLDELLDTRMGTIGILSPETARTIIASESYSKREIDHFDGVNDIEYKMAYSERTALTLRNSIMTGVVFHLQGLLGQLKEQAVAGPTHDSIVVHVNCHPYRLSESEKKEMARVVLFRLTNGAQYSVLGRDLVSVEVIDMTPEELTPAHCKASYGAMYMYNPWTWMNLHTDAFKSTRIPEVILYAPRLYFQRKPTAQELQEFETQFKLDTNAKSVPDQFTWMEMQASPLVGVTHIDVSYFSSSVRPR